ncbi:hypothetical protein SDC9_102119 [bioreactor metagenome]|uniref:Uncharacterized protein n=1 Tax=bioreactor metagenome TaxID=1076179 RepID=A0A645APY0_9ZZZZ
MYTPKTHEVRGDVPRTPYPDFLYYSVLLDDLASDGTGNAGGVGFVGIDMHGLFILGRDTADALIENDAAGAFDFDRDNLLVLDAKFLGLFGLKVNVTLCDHDALGDVDLSGRPYELAAGGTGNIARLTHRGGDAKRTGIGEADFNLSLGTLRSQNGHLELAFGANDGDLLLAGKLPRLRKVLLICELMASTVQRIEICPGDMQMTRRDFHHYIRFCQFKTLLKIYLAVILFYNIFMKYASPIYVCLPMGLADVAYAALWAFEFMTFLPMFSAREETQCGTLNSD